MKDLTVVKEIIAENVTLGGILRDEFGTSLDIDEIQLSCPFHGADAKKSARYYKETDSMYCWVCKKSWDIYGYISQKEGLTFSKSVDYIIKHYNIDVSKAPDVSFDSVVKINLKTNRNKSDGKAYALARIKDRLLPLRGKIEDSKYARLVFAFMLLKHNTLDEKFKEDANKLASLIVKLGRG